MPAQRKKRSFCKDDRFFFFVRKKIYLLINVAPEKTKARFTIRALRSPEHIARR